METTKVQVKTISPISIPLAISLGTDKSSPGFYDKLSHVEVRHNAFLKVNSQRTELDYNDIKSDTRENRLLVWQPADYESVKVHIFDNQVAIVESDLELPLSSGADTIAKDAQEITKQQIRCFYPALFSLLRQVSDDELFHFNQEGANDCADIHWITRCLLLTRNETRNLSLKPLIREWLKDTYRPDDAAEIIGGSRDYSLTWLNYVVVDPENSESDHRIGAMIQAQYFYTAQERCNRSLKQAIENAHQSTNLLTAEQTLTTSRTLARMHRIDYHEHLNYLNRFKRRIVQDILRCWDFEQLMDNGQRMIEICSSRLQDVDTEKREKSAKMTDLLLVTLSFFTVFELSLYLTEFSRELMTHPALDYTDDSRPITFEIIAGIDADYMFGLGFGLTALLVVFYKLKKGKY